MLKIGGGECSKKQFGIPISECPGQFTGGSDGGDGHGSQINGLATVGSKRSVASVGLDDSLRYMIA